MGVTLARIDWATAKDADHLNPLMRALYLHDVPDAPSPSDEAVSRHLTMLLAPTTAHRLAIAWDTQDRAIGLAAVGQFVSVSDPRPQNWHQMELNERFVMPDCRGADVGKALMSWVEEQAKSTQACRIDWHVKRNNTRGIAFYRRLVARLLDHRQSMRKQLGQGT